MSKEVKHRRGTNSEQAAFVGAEGEITYNTTNKRLSVHNGAKMGGFPVVHENGDNGLDLTLTGNSNITAKNINLKDTTLGSHVSVSSSGIRLRENAVDRLVIDNGSFIVKDSSNVYSAEFDNRTLYNASSAGTVDWGNVLLNDASSLPSIDWGIRQLYNADTSLSLDWNTRQAVNQNQFLTIDWQTCTLYREKDSAAKLSLDWYNQKAYDQADIQSINWNSRQLYDSAGVTSIDWNNRYLIYNGFNVISWNEQQLFDGNNGTFCLDWTNRYLYASNSETVSLDWDERSCIDFLEKESLNWQNRQLISSNGTSISLDWNNKVLSGNWTAENIRIPDKLDTNAYLLYDAIGNICVDWGNKLLQHNSIGSVNWSDLNLSSSYGITVDWAGLQLRNSEFGYTALDWFYGKTYSSDTDVSIDWQNRILSGDWTAQNLSISGRNVAAPSLSYLDNDLYIRTQMGAKGMMKHANSYALNNFRQKLSNTGLLKIIRGGDGFTNFTQESYVGIFDIVINNILQTYGTGGYADRYPFFHQTFTSNGVDYIIDDARLDSEWATEHFAITKPTGYISYAHANNNSKFLSDTFDIYYVSNTGAGGMVVNTGLYGGSYARYTGIDASGSSLQTRKLSINLGNPNYYQLQISGSGNTSYLLLPTVTTYNSTASSGRAVFMDYTRDAGPTYDGTYIDVTNSARTNIRDTVFSGYNPDLMLWLMSSQTSSETGHRSFFNTMKTKWPNCTIVMCGLFPYATGNDIMNMQSRNIAINKGYPYFDGYNTFTSQNEWSGRGFSRANLGSDPHPSGAGIVAYGQVLWDFLGF